MRSVLRRTFVIPGRRRRMAHGFKRHYLQGCGTRFHRMETLLSRRRRVTIIYQLEQVQLSLKILGPLEATIADTGARSNSLLGSHAHQKVQEGSADKKTCSKLGEVQQSTKQQGRDLDVDMQWEEDHLLAETGTIQLQAGTRSLAI
ncbi:UNVERIFIED_CONTAM: hypothetical protein Sradi_6424500 [Sesamum radiatum]|uniref:Uncharacterized protein n=1 Tax=Sesamum radiatum TaxID=300843 RepID=A0AAW2K5K7_SESRA